MKRKVIFFILLVIFLGAGSAILLKNRGGKPVEKNEDYDLSLSGWDFRLPDISGEMVSLNDFNGRVILLTFWMIGCPYCIREIPILKRIQSKYNEKDVKIISVVIGEEGERVKKFKVREEIPYLILLDEKHEVAHLYKVIGVPTDIIIDRKGKMVYYNFFWPKNLEEIIEGLL
ncbi:MAG: TlpA family protein disulfide reductase [Candidatus Omnitrophica bacterium]|nr:TlpA family protein disulfide reductase [Candidatus Omnitrophota bacterium]MCM8793028.1 TlpA family protein disulfide reductase [Candidatus Omnitrophota bacterium]